MNVKDVGWEKWKASNANVKVIFHQQLSVLKTQLVKFITTYLRKYMSGPHFFVQVTAGGRRQNTALFA
jgi:hypothetical protein